MLLFMTFWGLLGEILARFNIGLAFEAPLRENKLRRLGPLDFGIQACNFEFMIQSRLSFSFPSLSLFYVCLYFSCLILLI